MAFLPGSKPLPSRSSRTAPDTQDVLQLNCTLAKLLSIHPLGPLAGYHTEQGQFTRKKRHLFEKNKVAWFFPPPRKPARQSDRMHEGNIYADEQCGLFKREVKEQLFCSSILMAAKNKKCQDSAKGPHAAKEAARAVGVLRWCRDPEWETNES